MVEVRELVSVKPLKWEDADEGMCTKWRAAALGGHYELVAFEGEDGFAVNFSWGRPLSFWFIQGEPDEWGPTGPKMFPSLDEAKAAAQADFESRILSALSPASEMEPVALSSRPMEVSAMRDLVTILRTEAKNQRTPPIDYVIAEDGGRMVHRPDPDIAMAELLEEAASALAAKDAELAAVRQQYVDANEARIDAEAQLAEARKALEPFAEDYEKHSRLSEDV